MNWPHIRATINGAWKSLTVWVAGIAVSASELIPLVQGEWPSIATYLPDWLASPAVKWMALAMVILRIKTAKSLAEKSRNTP